jgi:hypothetical protein
MGKLIDQFGMWVGRTKARRVTFIVLAMSYSAAMAWFALPLPWHAKLLVFGILVLVVWSIGMHATHGGDGAADARRCAAGGADQLASGLADSRWPRRSCDPMDQSAGTNGDRIACAA